MAKVAKIIILGGKVAITFIKHRYAALLTLEGWRRQEPLSSLCALCP